MVFKILKEFNGIRNTYTLLQYTICRKYKIYVDKYHLRDFDNKKDAVKYYNSLIKLIKEKERKLYGEI